MAANDKKTTKQTLERVKAWANQEFVRNTVNNLVNYYLKSETYTKAEVQQLLNAIKQFTYQVAPSLPTASADTMNVIYLVPTEDPKTKNVKDEFITIDNGAGAATRYTWEQIGSTQIDLSGYYTSAQTDAAITAALNSALANYTTTTNLNTLLSGKVDKVSGKGLSTNDYTNEEKAKLGALPTEAELNNEFAISGVYDVSAKNPTAGPNNDGKFTLDYILDSNNVNTLIPTAYRKGGMSIKFVQSSDNKYIQCRLTKDEWSANVSDWIECDSNKIEGKVFFVTDGDGNIIAKIDKDGVHSVDFKVGLNDVSLVTAISNEATTREESDAAITGLVEAEEARAKAVEDTKLNCTIADDKFCITDANGYIICQIDASGVHSVNIDEHPNIIDDDELVITDSQRYVIAKIDKDGVHAPNIFDGSFEGNELTIEDGNGYIIAKIDANGVHSAKDKHAVACMVLSEAYYPTAAPTRDSDGNVTYAKVMFETGVAGSISITYSNGVSSSVAVVYGNYNYTITINRDAYGNVETVSVN